MMGNHAMLSSIAGVESGIPVLNGSYANYRIYETKDGRFMVLGALEYKFWSVCQAVGEKQWLNDFPNQLKRPEIHADIERLFRARDFQDWIKIGKQYDCCLFPVLEISEVLKDDYVNDRDLVHILDGQSFVQTSHHSLTKSNRIAKLNEHADLLSQDPKV
nr:CoA transferase [Piscibacillus salipiscarius]